MAVVIPQDIIDNVIEAVGNDSRLLETCALVSSSFLLPSRKRLFSEISLRNDQACQRLHQFLVENPVVQSFVRSITISRDWHYNPSESHLNGTSLIAILRLPFCRLENFSINIWRRRDLLNWNDFSSELKEALSAIIHSPTLKVLNLHRANVPIMLFQGIHLTKLKLISLSPNDFDCEQSKLLTATPEGTTTSHAVVDHCDWRFFSNSKPVLMGRTEPIFLPFMCRLRVFEIYIDPFSAEIWDFDVLSVLMLSLCVSLTSPATLEHLKFAIVFQGNSNTFDHYAFYDDLRDADVWRHLDSIITHPTGSRLQRVDIDIRYIFRYDDDVVEPDNTEILESILDALPLLREKGILSVEANVRR